MILLLLLAAAPLPDLPALGRLDGVLGKGEGTEKTIELQFSGCEGKVPVNLSRLIAGSSFAMQQMLEWMRGVPDLKLFSPKVLDEVSAGIREGAFKDVKPCDPKRSEKPAPKLCAGKGDDRQLWWLVAGKRAAASVRSFGPGDKCLPRLRVLFYDAKGTARVSYDADFGGEASGSLLGDGCEIAFKWDAPNGVFHAERRGCKGP